MEKLLKSWIVLADRRPPRSHELAELAVLVELELPAARQVLLAQIEQLLDCCAEAVDQLA